MCLLQMRGGRLTVHERLGGAELEQQIDAPVVGGRLSQRPSEICDCRLGGAAGAGTASGPAQAVDDAGVAGRRDEQQMGSHLFGLSVRRREEPGRARVRIGSLELSQRVVDGRPDQGMDEGEGRLRTQNVDTCEVRQGPGGGFLVQFGEGFGLPKRDVVAEHGHRPGEAGRLGRRRARRAESAREPARAARSRRRETLALLGATSSERIPFRSSRRSSGLPAVISWQAAQKASSASGDSVSLTRRAAAAALSGVGWTTVASGSETISDSSGGAAPPPKAATRRRRRRRGRPASGSRYASQRSEGRSDQCRSSTTSKSGWRVGDVRRQPVEPVQQRQRPLGDSSRRPVAWARRPGSTAPAAPLEQSARSSSESLSRNGSNS